MDRFGVIWTRVTGVPQKLADMVLTPQALRVTKTAAAIAQRLPGLSLLHDKAGLTQIVYPRSESRHLPPQLAALLPPNDPDNPQRRILSTLLERTVNTRGMPIVERDWHMLMFAGRNGLGHLDVFASDDQARDWYAAGRAEGALALSGSSLWFAFRHFVMDTASEGEEEAVIATLGPTPGVSGFVPKLLQPIVLADDGQWLGEVGDVVQWGADNRAVPAIIKLEQERYPGLLALESLAYRHHAAAGFAVPRTWLRTLEHAGETVRLLAIERFDRVGGLPVPLESAFSILATGSPSRFISNIDGSMEDVARIFEVLDCPAQMRVEWFGRFVMALLTGNGDLHSENQSILGGLGEHRLSPVYDPAPMRAYRGRANHNLLSALPFAGIGGASPHGVPLPFSLSGNTPPALRQHVLQLATNVGIAGKTARQTLDSLLAVTADFCDEAADLLNAVPERKRGAPDIDGFVQTLDEVRAALAERG